MDKQKANAPSIGDGTIFEMQSKALQVLGLSEQDVNDDKKIRNAYLLKCRKYHPDKNNKIDNLGQCKTTYHNVKEAYDFLLSKNSTEEYFCVSSDRNGSSVSFNKQNPSLFPSETKRCSRASTTAEKQDTITFLLCPLCNQPYKKGRPLRAHLQSNKHNLSDNTTPSLADVIKDALQGVHIEGKVVSSAQPYSGKANYVDSTTHVAVTVTGMKRLKFHAENEDGARISGVSKRRKGELTVSQGKIRAKKKAAAAAATAAIRKKKLLHPGLAACRDGEIEKLKELLANDKFDIIRDVDNNGSNGIHWCAGSGYLNILKFLLDWCVTKYGNASIIHYRDKRSGRNAFHWASRNGRIKVCQYLLETFDMDINSITNDGTSAFHLTAWAGEFEMCRWLVENKCDPHIINTFGCNAIHFACLAGNLKMCKWLCDDLKLDVRLVQLQGHHTLHKAAWAGHKDVCAWLQDEIGIDPLSNVVDNKGHTASRLAEIAGHSELAEWLLRHNK